MDTSVGERIYFDWAATSPPDPVVLEEFYSTREEIFGNPSSLHQEGKEAFARLSLARESLASSLGTEPKKILFTSCGSEANTLVLLSLLRKKRPGRILISSIEHPAVYEYITILRDAGFDVREIPADSHGIIQPDSVEELLSLDTQLIAVMTVNNETGAIQPIQEIARRIRSFEHNKGADIHFHSDAVQAFGKIEIELSEMDVDSASFSAHKISGPKGVGMLYLRREIQAAIVGGGQESGYRPGTENVPAITAFARAAERRIAELDGNYRKAAKLKDRLCICIGAIEGLHALPEESCTVDTQIFSPYILSFTAAPVPSEVLVRILNDRGFAVSTGSACSSHKKKKRGRVPAAMGVSDRDASGAVRVSFGWMSSEKEVEALCTCLEKELPPLLKTLR